MATQIQGLTFRNTKNYVKPIYCTLLLICLPAKICAIYYYNCTQNNHTKEAYLIPRLGSHKRAVKNLKFI